MQILEIGYGQLLLSLIFVFTAGVVSLIHRLGVERILLLGTVRTFIQLFVMGYALKIIFGVNSALLVIGVYLFMILFAGKIVHGRVKERSVPFMLPTMAAMVGSYMLVSITVTGLVVGAEPWWLPRYFLPLGGMVIGNSMNAISIALERLFKDLRTRRNEVEMRLALGATADEASHTIVRDALKAGMIPSINSMMGAGIVFIPGMMTGQILAGADPQMAIRYQIVIMVMLVGSTSLGTLLVIHLARRRCFSQGQRLLLSNS